MFNSETNTKKGASHSFNLVLKQQDVFELSNSEGLGNFCF